MTQPFTHTPDMDEVRANVLERIIAKLKLHDELMRTTQMLAAHADVNALINPGRLHIKSHVNGLINHVELLHSVVEEDIWPDVEQFAFLFARDVIVDTVRREGGTEPVVMLTGNSFMPAFRSFDEIESIWQADDEGTYVGEMWERIERKSLDLNVILAEPDYDNCIYGVDMRKWEPSEAMEKDQQVDNLNEEWSWIDPEPKDTSADEARGYVGDIEALASAVESIPGKGDVKFVINQRVKFIQPNKDTDIHTIAAIGRDSDNDVWVKLDAMDADPIFDWATILVAVD